MNSTNRVLVCQLEISAETSLYALKMGGDNGAITIFNPAPAVEKLNTGKLSFSFLFFSAPGTVVQDSHDTRWKY